jgi:hypothetical protein
MSTKKLGRSTVEGGHPSSVKYHLRRMHRSERLQARQMCRHPEFADEAVIKKANHEKGKKFFRDDMHNHRWRNLLTKYFLAHVGRPVSEALRRLNNKHRSNRSQDRNLREMARNMIEMALEYPEWESFVIDEAGVIRERKPDL